MNRPFVYHKKTIVSGSTIEQLIYERYISHGFTVPERFKERRKAAIDNAKRNLTQEQLVERRKENRKLAMNRARNTLTRLINSNVYQYFNTKGRPYPPIFLTLTFAEDIRNQKQANKLFTLFIKRLNYEVHKNKSYTLKYSVVVEFQDKTREGVIHYHVLFYDLPYIHVLVLQKIWREGTIDIHQVKKVKSISKYVTKYMHKNFQDERLDGHKRYFSSRGLIKPKIYAGVTAFETIKKSIPENTPKVEDTFVTKKKGKVIRAVYTLKDKKGLLDILNSDDIDQLRQYGI